MHLKLLPRLLFVAAALAASATVPQEADRPLAITNVTLVDASGALPRPGMTVVIQQGRIAAISPASSPVPASAKRVDGTGKFLIPGLWDMHVHLSWSGESALPVLLANGITGVRDMGGKLEEIDALRHRIALGRLAGPPRIVRAGPILNGKAFNPLQLLADRPEEARGIVRALKHVGADFIKVHRRVPREAYFAIMDEANKLGLRVAGHVPITVSPMEASAAGQASLEHTETLFEGVFSEKLKEDQLPGAIAQFLESPAAEELFSALAQKGTVVTPTLIAYQSQLDVIGWLQQKDPLAQYVSATLLAQGLAQAKAINPAAVPFVARMFDQLKAATRRMIAAGVPLMTGTDLAGPRIPGFPIHGELQILVEAGMTPLQALRAATLRPAQFLGKDADLGTIAVGKQADLVLLDADPLADIRNTRKIAAVVANGTYYARTDLDRLLADGARLAAAQ